MAPKGNGNQVTEVVEIDGTKYTSISAALETITDGSTKTIKLISSNIKENVKITGNKKVILDLNGFTLESNNDAQETIKDAIYVENGSDLTINDSSETDTTEGTGKVITTSTGSNWASVYNNGNVVINAGTFYTNNWHTIVNHGTMLINGGTITKSETNKAETVIENGYVLKSEDNDKVRRDSYKSGINEENPTLTITGGNFSTSGENARNIITNNNGGVLEISGGSFENTGTYKTKDAYDGSVISNYNETKISGGTFTAEHGSVIENNLNEERPDDSKGSLEITGGEFVSSGDAVLFKSSSRASVKGSGTVTVNGGTYETSNAVSTSDSLTNVVINEATFTDKLDTTGLDKVNVAGATATINTDSNTYIGTKTITNLANNAKKDSIITIKSGSISITTTNSNVTIVNDPSNIKGLIVVNDTVIHEPVKDSNSSSSNSGSSETSDYSKDWVWSNKLGRYVYKVSNSKVD